MNEVVRRIAYLLPAAALAVSGCDLAKSSNPLSSTVAGPMAGVSVGFPLPLTPSNGTVLYDKDQPLTLVMNNPESNSPRPLTVKLQIATDAGFSTPVVSIDGLTPGGDGKIRYRMTDRLPFGRTYFWRTQADDGANISDWSSAVRFDLLQTIIIGTPVPKTPVANDRIAGVYADLIVTNGSSSGPFGSLVYQFQVSDTSTFASLLTDGVTLQGNGETKYGASPVPDFDKTYYWRARTYDGSNPNNISEWTRVETFRSALAPPPPPPPGPGPVPIGSGDWQSCAKGDHGNKLAIVTCVHDAIAPVIGADGAFEVTKRVAWILRNDNPAGGLMIKNGGENVTCWRGKCFSSGRMMFSDFNYVKILSDVGGANNPSWQEQGPGDPSQYVPAMDPSLPEPEAIASLMKPVLDIMLERLNLSAPPSRATISATPGLSWSMPNDWAWTDERPYVGDGLQPAAKR